MQQSAQQTAKRIVVVTGANKGIGLEVAKKVGAAGCRTILACRNPELGQAAANDLIAMGYDAEFRQLDVSNSSSISSFASSIASDYGHLDVLVNNGAMAFKSSDPTPFEQQAEPTITVNYFGTLEVTNALLPLLRKGIAPSVVNVASFAGKLRILKSPALVSQFTAPTLTVDQLNELMRRYVSEVKAGVAEANGWPKWNYGVSKLGLIALTKVLAKQPENSALRINACCPGSVMTEFSSQKGNKTPEEGARTPAMLALLPPTGAGAADAEGHVTGKFYADEKEVEW